MAYDDSDSRHWRFVYESLQEMRIKLKDVNADLYIFHAEVLPVFEALQKQYHIHEIFSHIEVGNKITYNRDLAVQQFCHRYNIAWKESPLNGVIRKLKTRKTWQQRWQKTMTEQPKIVPESGWNILKLEQKFYEDLKGSPLAETITTRNKNFQQGGEYWAWRYLNSFIKERAVNYSKHISKPLLSRKSCSRLSPYLTYGNISMRMLYQYTSQHYATSPNKRALSNFISRLHWHCHFMQKFEDECRMEFENVNAAFDQIEKPRNEIFIKAWQYGKTGVPIIDACMRCLVTTGYLNFRMRAMVVSFFVFNLWQDWRDLHFLARQFLDYEPGIHWSQLQMQSGTTGINTTRVYNPIKQAQDHDPNGVFIRRWLPAMRRVPDTWLLEPWKMPHSLQVQHNVYVGKDLSVPIVELEASTRAAKQKLYAVRAQANVRATKREVLQKHGSRKRLTTVKKTSIVKPADQQNTLDF